MTGKPPYRVPTMAEIRAVPGNGLVAVSTFSGGGGSCTGYRMAGWRVAWANEFEPAAAATYRANHPGTVLDQRDIRTVTGADILDAVGLAEVDLLDGSPPCQSFSSAGPRTRSWGRVMNHADGTHQRSDDLFWEYTRLVGELRPRAFVAENVKGLVSGAAKGMFKRIMAELASHGYRVRARLLDAQWLGVPQSRKRVFIVGLRDDLHLEPVFPRPLGYRYSIIDACPWLAPAARPSPMRLANGEKRVTIERDDLRTEYGPKHVKRMGLNEPSPTIMAAGINGRRAGQASVAGDGGELDPETGENLRPSNTGTTRRQLTIGEVRRLCGFPDDYTLLGTYHQRWARLGNSVPPPMAAAVGAALADSLRARG